MEKYLKPNTQKILEPSYTGFEIEEYYKENEKIINLISLYTKQKENHLFNQLSNLLIKRCYNVSFDDIKENQNNYEYIDKEGNIITFDKLSKYIDDNQQKKELTSNKRRGKCHRMSMALANDLKDSTILTGYIVVGNYKVLHSVVETTKNNKQEILDWTKNLIMDKEEYIKLFNFTVLSEIKSIDLLTDLQLINNIFPGIDGKTYLVFRDELMKDLEKNQFMFEDKKKGR